MYINAGSQITNTPTRVQAGYNTWPYQAARGSWYQPTPYYYTLPDGSIQKWNSWNPSCPVRLPGGMYKGTPTRTGGFYLQNIA